MAKKHNEPMDLAVGPVFLSDITVKGGPEIPGFPSFESPTHSYCDFPCVCGGAREKNEEKESSKLLKKKKRFKI